MNAQEARKMSVDSANSPTVDDALSKVYGQIMTAAKQGFISITNVYLSTSLSEPQKTSVFKKLELQGYKIKHESDQREGKSWTTISW